MEQISLEEALRIIQSEPRNPYDKDLNALRRVALEFHSRLLVLEKLNGQGIEKAEVAEEAPKKKHKK